MSGYHAAKIRDRPGKHIVELKELRSFTDQKKNNVEVDKFNESFRMVGDGQLYLLILCTKGNSLLIIS